MDDIVFPELVLLEIFSYLSVEEVVLSRRVCKQWNTLIQSDNLWKKMLKKWKDVGLQVNTKPASSAYQTIIKMWQSSKRIGKERWYDDPLPQLWFDYESSLREAQGMLYCGNTSSMYLYLRLNPCYEFTTKGKDIENEEIESISKLLWEEFGNDEENPFDIKTHKNAMSHARYVSREKVMNYILDHLEPYWLLEGLQLSSYSLDEDGNIDENKSYEEKHSDDEDFEAPTWLSIINHRLPVNLYRQLKALFADKSHHFIEYYMSEGCINENYQYGHFLYISCTAALYVVEYYDL